MSEQASTAELPSHGDGWPAAPSGPRRLLTAIGDHNGAAGLRAHRATYAVPSTAHGTGPRIIEMVRAAGLRGRGGAGFPAATKLASVAAGHGRRVVVANGTEGEPTSRKDRLLLHRAPHLVLDGAVLAAIAVGADQIVVCVDRSSGPTRAAIEHAISERAGRERSAIAITLEALPPRYVAGEESALVHWLNGGDAKPTLSPPRPFESGVDGRPTLVSNVETLAHLAQIVRWGPTWFREQGRPESPGTLLATIGGAVRSPGIAEVATGTPLIDVVRSAGGPTNGVQALLVGGYFGSWLSPRSASTARLSNESLSAIGASVGCAAVMVLPDSACGVVESARILAWFAAESAGQCGSCVHGLAAIADGAADLLVPGAADLRQLERWARMVEGRGACHLPTGAVRFLRSALSVFADDITRHAAGHHCAGSYAEPLLPAPLPEVPVQWR